MYPVCVWCLRRPKENIGSHKTGLIDGCELPYGVLGIELRSFGPLKEK